MPTKIHATADEHRCADDRSLGLLHVSDDERRGQACCMIDITLKASRRRRISLITKAFVGYALSWGPGSIPLGFANCWSGFAIAKATRNRLIAIRLATNGTHCSSGGTRRILLGNITQPTWRDISSIPLEFFDYNVASRKTKWTSPATHKQSIN